MSIEALVVWKLWKMRIRRQLPIIQLDYVIETTESYILSNMNSNSRYHWSKSRWKIIQSSERERILNI